VTGDGSIWPLLERQQIEVCRPGRAIIKKVIFNVFASQAKTF
jgi:hypothetical protein